LHNFQYNRKNAVSFSLTHKMHSFLILEQEYNIETFATKLGVDKIAKGATLCLLLNYIHAILTGALAKAGTFNPIAMIGGHFTLATILLKRFSDLDTSSMASIKKYYKHIWDLFYLEYVLYTLI
jgi:homogentisate solanesyltransferase